MEIRIDRSNREPIYQQIVLGRACFADEPPAEFIRPNFSYPDEDQIRKGIARLAGAIRQETGFPHTAEIWAASTRPIV